MKELNQKYVLHIPKFKFENDELHPIELDNILDELIGNLEENGHASFYMQKIESLYKSRSYEELTITVFSSKNGKKPIDEIFSEWFESNSNVLAQEEYAYEHNNCLIIKKIID